VPRFLDRLLARRRAADAAQYEQEREMSKRERDYIHERVEDHAADELAESMLGGFDPAHPPGDERPPDD